MGYDGQAIRVSAVRQDPTFPRNAVGVDSWANVYLTHSRTDHTYPNILNLAHGTCEGSRETAAKGVPMCYVPFVPNGENIDLFPEGYLWDRVCSSVRGDENLLTTPKKRVVQIHMWGTLPYLLKDDLARIIADLPDIAIPGRSGRPASSPTCARASRSSYDSSYIRKDLEH